jgi:HD-GYP domain-containing protein (c-di-GMP phosphodiesterase class II)
MDQRLPERAGHSERVTRYTVEIAQQLGLPEDSMSTLRLAAYIHDIGMLSIPDALLRKPTSLTTEERKLLQSVPAVAQKLLAQVNLPEFVVESVVHLREWYDGSGHPAGLRGEAIPLGARIVAVADALDALTSPRAHRSSVSIDVALEQIDQLAGTQFDPAVAAAASSLAPSARRITSELRLSRTVSILDLIMSDLEQLEQTGGEGEPRRHEDLAPFNPPG